MNNSPYHEKNKEKIAAWRKAYYQTNKEKEITYAKTYYEKNKKRRLKQVKLWAEKNPDKVKHYHETYVAKQKGKKNAGQVLPQSESNLAGPAIEHVEKASRPGRPRGTGAGRKNSRTPKKSAKRKRGS